MCQGYVESEEPAKEFNMVRLDIFNFQSVTFVIIAKVGAKCSPKHHYGNIR